MGADIITAALRRNERDVFTHARGPRARLLVVCPYDPSRFFGGNYNPSRFLGGNYDPPRFFGGCNYDPSQLVKATEDGDRPTRQIVESGMYPTTPAWPGRRARHGEERGVLF
jgi:hypothetical protein